MSAGSDALRAFLSTFLSRGVPVSNNAVCFLLVFFSGVPAVVDFAAMRDAVKRLGGDPGKINPLCPVDLVIDHSVQVDVSRRYLSFDKF